MSPLANYARTYSRDADNNFAVACYEQNTEDELETALGEDADETDITTWGLVSSQEWRDALRAALADKRLID